MMTHVAGQAISEPHEQGATPSCRRCGGDVMTEVDERGRKRRICLACLHTEAPAPGEPRIAIRRQAQSRLRGGTEG